MIAILVCIDNNLSKGESKYISLKLSGRPMK